MSTHADNISSPASGADVGDATKKVYLDLQGPKVLAPRYPAVKGIVVATVEVESR